MATDNVLMADVRKDPEMDSFNSDEFDDEEDEKREKAVPPAEEFYDDVWIEEVEDSDGNDDHHGDEGGAEMAESSSDERLMMTPQVYPQRQLPAFLEGLQHKVTDNKKKKSEEEDVAMVTAFQETQMLKSEVVLHEAARKNNVEVARKLLQAKVNVNCTNNLDRTPLQWAAANGNKDVMELLLQFGADIEAQDKYGMRPILWASWFGHTEVVKFLVCCGADTSCINKQGLNLIHCAANQNHADVLTFIFENLDNYSVAEVDKRGRSALHLAAQEGHLEIIEKLLEKKCEFQKKDKTGQTPLHLAAANGHTEISRRLIAEMGLDIDDRDEDGRTSAHLAAENGHAECVDLFYLSNADPNAETLKEMTSLHLAASTGHELVTRLIIEYGCNVNAQNFQGNTALHLAAVNNQPSIIRILIDSGCDVDLPNHRLLTALHAAVEKGHADAVEELLISGANLDVKEKGGRTALYMASRGSFIGIVDMIIKADRERAEAKARAKELICGAVTSTPAPVQNASPVKPVLQNGGVDVPDSRQMVSPPDIQSLSISSDSPRPQGHDLSDPDFSETDTTNQSTVTRGTDTTTRTLEPMGSLEAGSLSNEEPYVRPRKQFKQLQHAYADQMKAVLYKLATKQLKPGEWKRLAHFWKFSEEHIRSIQHQYTGETSYKEHGYRMLLIWLHGIKPDDNPMRELYEALCAIGRRNLAEQIRKKVEEDSAGKSACAVS